jgi:hypothetical protein
MTCGAPTTRASSASANHTYCYPLTVTDQASRFLLLCEARVPFASANALFNLSKLAVWWLRLGIAIERIKPGHPA